MRGDGGGYAGGEGAAIDGEGVAPRDARAIRQLQQKRIQAPQLLFEKPGRGTFLLGLEGIAADQLGQQARLMGGRRVGRPHLMQDDLAPGARRLTGGFRARQSSTDDVNGVRQGVSAHCNHPGSRRLGQTGDEEPPAKLGARAGRKAKTWDSLRCPHAENAWGSVGSLGFRPGARRILRNFPY